MRIKLVIRSIGKNDIAPLDLKYYQALIYNLINDKDFSSQIHEKGLVESLDNSRFKFFTFALRFPKNKNSKPKVIEGKWFKYNYEFYLYISSVSEKFIAEILSGISRNKGMIRIKDKDYRIEQVVVPNDYQFNKETLLVRTLSPIIVPQQYIKENMQIIKNPTISDDVKFKVLCSESIVQNMMLKYATYHAIKDVRELKKNGFYFKIEPVGRIEKVVFHYKEVPFTAYYGVFKLSGNKELLEFAYNVGLGAKNSAGFGMIEPLEGEI